MIQTPQVLLDAQHTTDLRKETGLERKLIVLSLQILTRLQEIADSNKFSVLRGREIVTKKVAEVLETGLSSLVIAEI